MPSHYEQQKASPYSRSPAELPQRAEVGVDTDQPVMTQSSSSMSLRDEKGEFDASALILRSSTIYSQSTNYLTTNISNDWEINLSHFHGEHAKNSKYRNSKVKRSKIFRPKTRAAIKQQEAGLATAMFSSTNLIDVRAQDTSNEDQVLSAAINKALLQHRLSQTMPWVATVLGAYQDTKVYGICVSHQYWSKREKKSYTPLKDEAGEQVYDDEGFMLAEEHVTVQEDKLVCDLIPPENFRFDPASDWRDPANTSSYLIITKAMRVIEVENMMRKNGGTWKNYSRSEVHSATMTDTDRVRYAREGSNRTDPTDSIAAQGLNMVWVHMYIVRDQGEDLIYWTLGTQLLLTMPENLHESESWLRAGERPVQVGFSTIEAHKNYPSGDVQQSRGLQEEINDVANLRSDNVRLALNKRYYAKRGSQINIGALVRNTPGSVVMTNDPEKDIKEVNTPDVTNSSYREQETLASEMDQLVGGFDAQRIAQDGASPGGIARAGAVASAVQDYGVFIFVESWVEPVLSQLLRLEQAYEEDEFILAIAAKKAGVMPENINDELLEQDLVLKVDASIGTLDPLRKVERLRSGVETVINLPGMSDRIKPQAVASEVFSSLGWSSTDQFFLSEEEYQEKMEANPPGPSEMDVKMRELDIREGDNTARDERERMKLEIEALQKDKESGERDQRSSEDRIAKLEEKLLALDASDRANERDNQTKRDIAAANLSSQTREQNLRSQEQRQQSSADN